MNPSSLSRAGSGWLGVVLTIWALGGGIAKAQEASTANAVKKPTWKWTTDERLSQRFEPEAMAARAAERAAEQQAFLKRLPKAAAQFPRPGTDSTDQASQAVDMIEGSKTPALFLPFELFDHLLAMGFPPGGNNLDESRRIIEERAVALGFGRDLWKRLEKAATPYLALRREDPSQVRTRPRTHTENVFDMDDEALRYCRTRAAALAAVKAEFGEESFLRLLYIGATPGFTRTYAVSRGTENHMRFLKFQARGCQ